MSTESPEQLIDVFKAAALSVTKLYKTSAAAQTKSRADGYQDCLDDLLAFLDRENIGLSDGEGWRIRRWATERLDGRDGLSQTVESEEDEADKAETASSPDVHRASSVQPARTEVQMRDSAPPTVPATTATNIPSIAEEQPEIVVPSQETFTFQSQMPYPRDYDLNLANLDLSDSRLDNPPQAQTPRSRTRHASVGLRAGSRTSNNHLGRGVGSKRKLNFAEIFDLGSLGNGKDMFGGGGGGGGNGGGGGKRSRHA